MGKNNKENRSDWVAVAPEFDGNSSSRQESSEIRPAMSAYQYFQREVTPQVKQELGPGFNVGEFSRAVRDKWAVLDSTERIPYEDLAREDAARFARESHLADIAALERQEKLRQEREELIVYDEEGDLAGGKRSTRGGIKKQQRKKERRERKKEKKPKKQSKRKSDDGDSDYDEISDDGESSNGDDDYASSSSSSSYDSDDSSRPKRRKVPPKKVSAAVIARREQARVEKEEKEQYIAERQEELRFDRAAQAKRRLDFLLKQSDIFSHFGAVKQDETKLATRSSSAKQKTQNDASEEIEPSSSSRRRDSVTVDNSNNEEVDQAALEDADEHNATFLTSQPSTLGFGKMRDYQLEGLNWMIRLQEHGVNGILADEMGLGKTLQSISVLVYMAEYQDCTGPHLIVVPKSTLSNWMNELKRWAPTLTAVKFHGTKDEREELARDILQPGQRDEYRTWHVCVTTYEVCNLDRNVLNKFAWSYLIIDEAHRLKNEASAFSRTIRTFETRYRLLLTGTPLQNNLHELWALLNFLVPDVFASAEQFDDWFNLDIDDADEKNKLISQLHKILRPFMLRRLKVDVEKSLPPKHETILFTGMSVVQKKLYKDILMRDIDMLQGAGGAGSRTAILNIVMQLRKCAGHPYLFPGVEDRTLPALGEHLVNNCGKMVLLDKLLKRLQETGHRVLLFTQMTRVLDILEDYMVMRHFQYCRIDGNTSYEVRENYIDAFNAPDSKKFIFLLSTRAGGLGINLQTADVVILYDSDWNPQADLQAQDRAHRIGQKREVQVFRLVTEHTIEEKVVERAQQKLKLDAMVVQQGRLKEKDKVSRDELLAAVRFGADKVFKSKDSSITDDDIDMILNAGKRKTQELNEKLQNADKGDMLDFKLDGNIATQTFEGVDYSGEALAQAKAAQAQAELLGILDIGKRERRTVANYNENQLYQQQIAALQGRAVKDRRKKEKRLPKFLRLPRMEEWQMFDRGTLKAIQEEEEKEFKSLPEEQQKLAYTNNGRLPESTDQENPANQEEKNEGDASSFPRLLSKERETQKKALLAEGFVDWGRHHYTAFIKASGRYGRSNLSKIALEVGKPLSALAKYAAAFWSEDLGKKRFSEHEYDRVVKLIEKGEKKIEEIKSLARGTGVLLSLFDNPWVELEFNHVNCKDKMFTMEEDRHLLCWAHKYGFGQWGAVKMAIRRSPNFRFDYFLRSLPTDMVGRRCEQLMKAAEKEVEQLEKKAREEAGMVVEEEKREDNQTNADSSVAGENEGSGKKTSELPPIELPMYKVAQSRRRIEEKKAAESKRKELESKVEEIEEQMRQMQNKLKDLQEYNRDASVRNPIVSAEFPDNLVPSLVNFIASSGASGIVSVANQFASAHPGEVSKRKIISKIEEVAKKEKREEDGDTKPIWYILPEYENMLEVDTLRHLRKAKEERLQKLEEKNKEQNANEAEDNEEHNDEDGAIGPDGTFVVFPEYDGSEPPRESKKAFTHFCMSTRREVKAALDPSMRKDKQKVNSLLKEKWFSLTDQDKKVWKKWEKWDLKRFARDTSIFDKAEFNRKRSHDVSEDLCQDGVLQTMHIPKKRKGNK